MRVLEVRWNTPIARRLRNVTCTLARSQHPRRRDPRAWHEAAAPAWERAMMHVTRAWSLEAGVALVDTRLARDPDRGDGRGRLKAATRMLRAARPRKTSLTGLSEAPQPRKSRDPHARVLPRAHINRVPRGSSTRERMHSGMMDSVRAARARVTGARVPGALAHHTSPLVFQQRNYGTPRVATTSSSNPMASKERLRRP